MALAAVLLGTPELTGELITVSGFAIVRLRDRAQTDVSLSERAASTLTLCDYRHTETTLRDRLREP